ncbi:MAG: hypothetical protein II359_04050 [Clostridia bacterium]|nr:hypothetical protein [Clostridia bacterium]
MKSFDEILENLPQEKELSAEEKERILSLAMQKIRKKPKNRQMKIRYAASMLAACLILVTVITMPYATQKKNTMQEAATENKAPQEAFFLTADMEEKPVQEDNMQAMRTESYDRAEDSIAHTQDTAENMDSVAQEKFDVETYAMPQTEETVQMNSALLDDVVLEEAAPEAAEESEAMPERAPSAPSVSSGTGGTSSAAEKVPKLQEDLKVETDSMADAIAAPEPDSMFAAPGVGGGGGSSAAGVVVITDNESYRSIQRVSGGKVIYENTHKRTNRVLKLADFFPTDIDYKTEFSLTGEEAFYITQDNHLVIVSASGERDIGAIIDGKIQK